MAGGNDMTAKVGLDTTAFKKGVSDLNGQIKSIETGFRASAAVMGDWSKSSEGLTARTSSLSEKLALQKQKLETLHQEYDKVVESQGANSSAAQSLANQMYSAEKAISSTEKDLEKYDTELKTVKAQSGELATASGSMADKIKGKFADMGSSLKSAFSTENIKTALGAVGAATAGFLQSAITSATAAQEKTETLSNLLQNQGITAEQADSQIKQFTSSITKMSAYSGGEAKDALQELTQKGIDSGVALSNSALLANIAAGSHKSLAESADLLADAYHGKTKALVSLGVLTKDEAKQLGDSETATISMTTVQDRLNERFGGAAQTQLGTYSGKMKENTNNINAAKTAIGTAMLPVLAQLADAASKILVPLGKFIQEHPKLTAGILAAVAAIGTLVGGMSMVNTVASGLGALGIAGKVASLLPTIGLVGLAVAGVAVAAALIITHWSQIKTFFKGLWDDIKGVFSGVGDWFSQKFTAAKDGVVDAWSGIPGFFSGIGDKIGGAFSGIGNTIKSGLTTALSGIGSFFSQFWANLTVSVLSVWEPVKTGLLAAWNGIKEVAAGAWELIKTVILAPVLLVCDLITGNFGKMKTDLDGIWNNIKVSIEMIWNGIVTFFTGIWGAISGGVQAFWTNFKTGFEALWADIKTGITTAWNGFKDTIIQLCGDIKTGIQNVWNGIIDWFKELPGKLKQIGSDMFTKMKEGVTATVGSVGTAAEAGITSAFAFIKKLPSDAFQWGKDIINGIVKGIKAAAGAVGDAVKGVAQDIRKFLHFSVPDEGPLADFDEWMPDMMNGMAKGIEANVGKVRSAARQAAASLSEGIRVPINAAPTVSTAAQALSAGQTVMQSEVVHHHDGTIRVEGINSAGQLEAATEIIMSKLRGEARM